MGILGWIILGGLAGWIASALTRSREGCLMYIVIGIVGAMIGGFAFSLIGGAGVSGFNLWSLFVAVTGSIILIAIVRAMRKKG
ncbi:MAG: GlsB/YeaQ/YmgE family stress response membrane protein [Armatimonadia bacterium]